MAITPEFLDELRARTSLHGVVGRRVKLIRAGREWKGCCPFHNEKTPSFYVNDDKGFYHCFGCGAHGDVIRFLTEQEGLTFIEAVKLLAGEAGMEVPDAPRRSPEEQKKAGLHDLLAAAAEWFAGDLRGPGGQAARDYLARRGVAEAAAQHFGLGHAPDSRTALSRALTQRFSDLSPAMLLEAGLIGQSDSGERYDRFRGRLMFPIHDGRGRVVGFGGRILGDGEPKYLNSAEGPLFAKGRLLYNHHRAAPAARKSGRLIIVEGYMDVIGLAGAGFPEAVAPLGTALTEQQIEIAWRLVDEPLLAFDGDSAGVRAGVRAATRALPLLKPGKSLRFLALPKGQDPDDIARSGGRMAVEALLSRAQSLESFLFEATVAEAPLDTPERRAAARARLQEIADSIADENLKRDYRQSFQRRFRDLVAPPPRAAEPARGGGRRRDFAPGPPPLKAETRGAGHADERILAMLLMSFAARASAVSRHAEGLAALNLPSRQLAEMRDALLDGRSPEALPPRMKPLWPLDLADDEFDRRAGDALASLIELHHIDAEMEQSPRMCLSDEQLAREQERRSLLNKARAKAIERLVAHAINGDSA